jgi:YesN/AraC family two-component response regulator
MPLSAIIRLRPSENKSLEQALAYIQDHFYEPISAEGLSEQFSITVKKLQLGIRRKTGKGLHEYHTQVRIQQAMKLLTEGELPIKRVSAEVGFKTASHFGQVFKDVTGKTPRQFRPQDEEPA